MPLTNWHRTGAAALFVACISSGARADDVIDSPMYRDPELPLARVVKTYPTGLSKLWLEALERPEADYKCNAALAIASAHERGLKGLDVTIAPLRRELDRSDLNPTARLAIVRALVILDARESAADLFKLRSADDNHLNDLIDPTLARWDHRPARPDWLKRLEQPPHKRATVRAIQSLVAVREERAAPLLRNLLFLRDVSPAVHLEAARALSILRPEGPETIEDANRLMADAASSSLTNRLLAATLTCHGKGEAAVRLLMALAKDPEPAVAAIALARLIKIDAKLVEPLLVQILGNLDPKVRGLGVKALSLGPSAVHIHLLGDRLSDSHPDVRSQARQSMRGFGNIASWRQAVIREATRVLDSEDWRGQEQAAIVLAQLGHVAATRRLSELLTAQRPEVGVAAAWALRKLAVAETLPIVLEHFRTTLESPKIPQDAIDPQLCQIALFLGQSKYQAASTTLQSVISPRSAAGFETRAAAIWALGFIHEGKPEPALVGALAGRVSAVHPGDLEDSRVRRMSAVSLGRLKAQGALPTLREFFRARKQSLDVVNNACGWAIEQITGERMASATVEEMQRDWFLAPLK
jgi:HEAT repeat protein